MGSCRPLFAPKIEPKPSENIVLGLWGQELSAGYHSSIDKNIPQTCSVITVNVELNYEQTSRLELIALNAGKPKAQMLLEAAQYLLDRDTGHVGSTRPGEPQRFLSDSELETRFARLLRY